MKAAKLFLILSVILSIALAKIVYVAEFNRHGAREPGVIFNFAKSAKSNFKHPKELTEPGMRQHYLIGHEIRNRYINGEHLINSTYNFHEVQFFMTDKSRAMESAESQISGIFPPEICQQTLTEFQRNNALPPLAVDGADKIIKELGDKALPDCFNILPIFSQKDSLNFAYHFEAANCPVYKKLSTTLAKSDEYAQLIAPIVAYLKPRLFQLTGIGPNLTLSDINDICSYITIADYHKLALKFKYK